MKSTKRSVFLGRNSGGKTKNVYFRVRKTLTLTFSILLGLLLLFSSAITKQNVMAATSSSAANITSYSLPGETGPASINTNADTIAVTVPKGTNVTALVANFTTSSGILYIDVGPNAQTSGKTPNNFTSPVTYTVMAQDGTTKKNWVVTVTIAPASGITGSNGAQDSNDGGQTSSIGSGGSSSSSVKSAAMSTDAETDETLTVNITGDGTVTQTLLAGSSSAPSIYAYYSEVQVTAVPAAGWTFTGWGGSLDGINNPNTVYMSINLTISATFQIVPTVTTLSSVVGPNSVILNGNLGSFGGSPALTSAQVAFEWGLGTDYGSVTPVQVESSTGAYSATITGIAAGTTFHYRAISTGDGTGYGADETFTTPSASANPNGWWNSSWNYRAEVDIAGTGTALSNYQISLSVPYNSNMEANFGDVRFVASDNATVLNYWMTNEISSSSATFWIEVPSISASGNTKIYMYFGNSSALTTSNIHTTFIFGDDFADPAYTDEHIVPWTGGAATQGVVMENGAPVYEMSGDNTNTDDTDRAEPIAQISNTDGSLMSLPANYIAEDDIESFVQNGNIFFNARYLTVNWKYEQTLDFEYNQVVENKVVNTVWTNLGITSLGYQAATNTWYDFKSVVLANGSATTLQTYVNGTQIGPNISDSDLPYPTYSGLAFLTFSVNGAFHSGFEDVRVRQYTAVEPSVALGSITQNSATLSNLTISSGTLTPTFVPATTNYTDALANNVNSLTVTPTTSQASSTVTVNGATVNSGSASGSISLKPGSNVITIIVTAPDGTTQDTYTITVTVAASNGTQITAYSLPGETGAATINSAAGTIGVTVPSGTNVTALVATFTTSAGVSSVTVGGVSQVSGTTANNFTSPVTYVVTAQNGTTTQNWVVSVTVQSATTEIIKSVATGADNGFTGSWGFYNTLTWLQVGNPGSPYNAWFRFTGITIPQGATIVHAYLVTAQSSWVSGTNLKISAEKMANPTAPTSNANEASLARTTANVIWNSGYSDSAYHNSPDIASVIQELVNNYNYSAGSAMQILVDNNGSSSPDQAILKSFQSGTAPELEIFYQTGAASNATQITAYSLPGETGAATINSAAGTIGVTVPSGTNVTALVATFTTSAGVSSVTVGGVSQISGTTANNFTSPVTYVVTAQNGTTTQNWVVSVTVQSATTEIIKSVATGADNGFTGSWGFYNTLTWLQVGNPGSPYNAWFRFTGITIPQGATIVHAYLVTAQSSWVSGTNLKISAEKMANPTAPTSNANEASLARTTANVIWNSGYSDSAYHNSPDIASVIQELVNNYNYSAGSAMQILVDNNGSSSPDQAILKSFQSGTAPELEIFYTVP